MLLSNKLKEKLSQGRPVIGIWNTLSSPLLTEVFAKAGLDFQIIDLEHGPFILDQVNLHVSACEGSPNCTPLVRIPSNQDWMALQALDQGAHGIVVPHISSRQDAEKLVSSIKYHPLGRRGFTPFSKAGEFNNNSSNYSDIANNSLASVAIIESIDALNNLDEIVEVNGIDIIYFGAFDLSQDLGFPGNTKHPNVIKAIQSGVDIVNKSGKYAGGFVPKNKKDISLLIDMGMRFITYEVDSSIIYDNVSNISIWFEELDLK
jgi:2-keto-3-deoxy-L-rhamnonate aldolase RhmA